MMTGGDNIIMSWDNIFLNCFDERNGRSSSASNVIYKLVLWISRFVRYKVCIYKDALHRVSEIFGVFEIWYLVSLGVDSIIYYGIKIKIIIRTLNRGENDMGTLCFPCGYSWSWQIYVWQNVPIVVDLKHVRENHSINFT